MPDYILHKVKKGETVWELSRKYGVEEHKIVQANPKKIKLVKKGRSYTPVIYEDDTLRIPQPKEEKVSYIIQGKNSLGMGESAEYELVDSQGNIPHYPSGKITWEFYVEEGNENWRKLRLEKEKTGQKFTIIFTSQKLKSKKIRIEAYLKRENSNEKLAEFFMTLDGEDIPEIKKLELLDVNRNKINRKVSYAETLYARAHCTGMEGETLYFTLWEDDAPGAGHSKENEENLIATKQAEVTHGLAEAPFPLVYSTMAPIANRKVPAGQKDEGRYHEYYVTVTRHEGSPEEKSSGNVEVNNPDYTPPPPRPQPKKKEAPKSQSSAPKVIHKDRVNNYPKPSASAWKEPKIIKVYLKDENGKEWTRRPRYGEKMRIYIESENMVNRKIKVRIYDKDKFSDDLLHEEDRTVSASPSFLTISLTKAMQDKGGDLWYQDIFAEVSIYETQQTLKSKIIEVDKTDFSIPKPEGVKVVTRNAPEQEKGEDCGQKYCIKKGDKNELIREINIRLAGFGGNVPTDEFTDRTEKMIKQFQRDYMKVPETGRICGNVLKAIDEFSSKCELPSGIWKKRGGSNTNEMLCPCGICTGFGKGRGKGEYNKTPKVEGNHKYEYPGIHRSLLWSLKTVLFYLSKTSNTLGYSFKHIESGYRCQDRNAQKGRGSTNHMGKALDLHFNKKGKRASSIKEMEDIRLNIFNKYLGAKWDWKNKNVFNLESTSVGATSWVHYDVREFDAVYLKDKYFTKTQSELNGKSIVTLAQELGFVNTCNCLGSIKIEKKNQDAKTMCYCFNKGHKTSSCDGKGMTISKDDYKKESERLGVEVAMMEAIAKQESKRSSFWEEGQATILFERHKMWEYLKKDKGKTDKELQELNKLYPNIVNKNQGGYGKYSEQYIKLEEAKKLDYATALKACSWGKFQVMGFNYDVSFDTPEDMENAVNACEFQQFRFFIGYLENTSGLIQAMKNKKWEEIARLYNGNSWRTINPDYANNIKEYYNEFKK